MAIPTPFLFYISVYNITSKQLYNGTIVGL